MHGSSELSPLGDASAKIPWPNGISKLDREFPSCSSRKSEKYRARIAVDQEIEATSSLKDLINQSKIITGKEFSDYEELDLMMAAALKWCYDIAYLIHEITERRQQGEQTCYIERETEECFQRKTNGSRSRRDACCFLHMHATGDREDNVGWSWETQEILTWSKHPLRYRMWKTQIDVKSLYSVKSSPMTKAHNSLSIEGKMKISSWDYRHHPVCRGYESGNRCIHGYRAYIDKLMVRATSARGRKEGTQGSVAILKEKTSKVVYFKTQIQWRLFHGKLKNWDWTLRRDTPEILRMHLVRNWIRERKRQSGGISQKGQPHERNPCEPVLRNNHLRKPHDKQIVSAKQRGIWREKYVSSRQKIKLRFYSFVKAPETQKIVCLIWIREHQCTMLSKGELSSDTMDTLRRSKNPTCDLPQPGAVQINEQAQVFVHDLDLFATVQLLDEAPAVFFASSALLITRIFIWVENGETLRLTTNGKSVIV